MYIITQGYVSEYIVTQGYGPIIEVTNFIGAIGLESEFPNNYAF